VKIRWIYSGDLTESNLAENFKGIDGMLIAPGFGDRGIEGKILAAKFARENKVPLWEFVLVCRL
jgi:CTP synthase